MTATDCGLTNLGSTVLELVISVMAFETQQFELVRSYLCFGAVDVGKYISTYRLKPLLLINSQHNNPQL